MRKKKKTGGAVGIASGPTDCASFAAVTDASWREKGTYNDDRRKIKGQEYPRTST